jgi:YD repeat-containing protein
MRRKLVVFLVLVFLIIPIGAIAQQGGTTYYVYDANGRLQVVIAPSGAAAVYQYDAAGNFTSISLVAPTTLQVYGFNPTSGGAGDQVTIFGTGFGDGSGGSGVTAVAFNGASAQIVSGNSNSVVATVPGGATTGPVSVTASGATASSSSVFSIVSRIRIVPTGALLLEGGTFQFTDIDSISGDTGVTWSVNGIVGGNSTVGTVSATGLYTAPNQTSNSITVTVASNLQPAASASAQVSVVNPSDITQLHSGVSVQIGNLVGSSLLVQAPSVSVRLGQFASGPSTDYSAGVSVTTGPVITSVSPSTLNHGSTATLTITGQNLAGVTAITFSAPFGAASNIAVSNIVASADGTSLTATVTVSNNAAQGKDIVVVTAGSVASLGVSNPTGSNTIQVQ